MVEELNSSNFAAKTKGKAIVDFWAPWCGPCMMMAPVFEDLSKDYKGKLNLFKVNVDQNGDLSEKFNVMSIPCLLIMENGQEKDRIVGFMPKQKLKEKIDAALK